MTDPNAIMLYVDHPPSSAAFYSDILQKEPIESHPTFALFHLDSGVKLGLWSKRTVEPAIPVTGVGGELAFSVPDQKTVEALYTDWLKRGLRMIQSPIMMEFGFTFVALDPDGYRLRVYSLSE